MPCGPAPPPTDPGNGNNRGDNCPFPSLTQLLYWGLVHENLHRELTRADTSSVSPGESSASPRQKSRIHFRLPEPQQERLP